MLASVAESDAPRGARCGPHTCRVLVASAPARRDDLRPPDREQSYPGLYLDPAMIDDELLEGLRWRSAKLNGAPLARTAAPFPTATAPWGRGGRSRKPSARRTSSIGTCARPHTAASRQLPILAAADRAAVARTAAAALGGAIAASGWSDHGLRFALGFEGHSAVTNWRRGDGLPPPWLALALAALDVDDEPCSCFAWRGRRSSAGELVARPPRGR